MATYVIKVKTSSSLQAEANFHSDVLVLRNNILTICFIVQTFCPGLGLAYA